MIRFFASLVLASWIAFAAQADWIVSSRWVVTMDSSRRLIENGAVAVQGGSILAVGPRGEIERQFRTRRKFHAVDAILSPGLINTHTHAAMSLFRGLADDLRLQEWLEKYIFPAEAKNVSRDFVRAGTELACLEMLLGGTTTFTDMYYFEDVVAEAARRAGMRGVLGQTIIGIPVADAKSPEEALRFTESYLQRFANDPLIVPAVAPHAIYTNSDQTLRAARSLANRYGKPLILHLSETKRENDDTVAKRGASPTKILDSLGMFEGRTVAAHGVWLDDDDLRVLKAKGVGVAHCPSSNMKLSSGVAPVVKMLSMGLAVGLGPDGPAGSNNDFSLFEEMDLAAKLQKVTTGDPRALPAEQAFEMATLGGARVLGMEAKIGSLEVGKRADLIVIRTDQPHGVPFYNLYSQLVYSLKASDVSDVMVEGKWVVRERQPMNIAISNIRAQAERYRRQIAASVR